MAEKTYKVPFHEIEEELRCPVCQEQLHQPKQLPCQHLFCSDCLGRLETQRRRNKEIIECPVCRRQAPLPEGGVDTLPLARLAANLLDKYKRTDPKDAQHDIESECFAHGKPFHFYCIDCQVFLCYQCSIEGHADHRRDAIGNLAKERKESIKQKLGLVKEKCTSLQHAFDTLVEYEVQLAQQESEVERQIDALAERLVAKVRDSQRELLRNTRAATEKKKSIILAQKEKADKLQQAMKSCQESMEKLLQNSTDRKIITSENQSTQQLETAINSIDLENMKQVESLEIVFQKNQTLEGIPLHDLGSVVSGHIHEQCIASGKGLQVATVEEEASFEVVIGDHHSSSTAMFSCQIKPEDPHFVYQFVKKSDSNRTVVCSYIPASPGPHTLSVRVGSQDIPSSPFSLTVLPMAKQPKDIFEGLGHPCGIAVMSQKSQLVVAEKGSDCITQIDLHQPTTQRKSFPLSAPHGIAISPDGQILAVSQGDKSLVKVNMDEEKVVEIVGGEDYVLPRPRPLSFNDPTGIAVSPDGTVFVTEHYSHHIQVLHGDLTYSKHLGSFFWGPSYNPCDLALDTKGMLYVLNQNHFDPKIVVLSTDGKVKKTFGSDKLVRPSAIALSSCGTVFVTDKRAHQIMVFSAKGEFLTKFGSKGNGKGEFNQPTGLAIDEDQVLYISDSGNNRIVTYKLQ